MARSPPILFAWIAYFFMFSAAWILLGGVAASQRYCGRAAANAFTVGGGSGYFANVSCDKLYRFAWWTTFYQIAMIVVVPVVLGIGAVHKWRYGALGLLLPLTYVLMETANAFYLLKLNIESNQASARTVLAGAIIGSVANYFMIILLGVHQEKTAANGGK